VVLDRSKLDSSLLSLDWSDPHLIYDCFGSKEMKLGQRRSPDAVRKCSIPVEGRSGGLANRHWIGKTLDDDMIDSCAATIEDFSNNIDGSRRMPKCPKGSKMAPHPKSNKCKQSKFPLGGELSHPDLHYAELAFLRMKRAMSCYLPEEYRESLRLVGEGMETKKLQVAAMTVLFRDRCQSAPQERTTQELHMDR